MASSSKLSAAKVNLFGKRNLEDDLEPEPILKKHKETSEEKAETTKGLADQANLISVKEAAVTKKTLFIGHLPPTTNISDILHFFKDAGEVVRVRLTRKWAQKKCFALVDFASAIEANKALEKKNGEYLHDCQIFLREDNNAPYPTRPKFCMDHKVWNKVYLRQESLLIEEDETPPDFEILFLANLSPQTKILHIKDFFKDIGEVVRVRLIVNHEGKHVGYAFVGFASSYQAKKALEKKNGEYLHDHKIFLEVAMTAPDPPRPKSNLAEKLCYEDYLRRQNFLIEEDEAVDGLDESPNFETVAVRKKTLFVSGLSHEADISHIINFFKDIGEVVHVRLIVDYMGEPVGDGFVEFAFANEAEKALEKKNGEYLLDHKIFLDVAKKAPYPPLPKYCIDHKVWYEDYLRRERLLIEEDEAVEGFDEILNFIEEVASRRKTLFVSNIPYKAKIPKNTKLPKIIDFFKDVGQVVCFRLIVDHSGEPVGCGFVEFASANEAEKALEKKNGEYLLDHKIFLDVAERAPYPIRPKYNLAEKLWSKVESLLIDEEEKEEEEDEEDEEEEEDDDMEAKPNLKKQEVPMMGGFCGKKIIFCCDN